MKKSTIRELDRCEAWLKDQTEAVKTVDMEAIAPPTVTDKASWARRTMRKMEDTGRAMADSHDSRSGATWWVHPDGPRVLELDDEPAAYAIRKAGEGLDREFGMEPGSGEKVVRSVAKSSKLTREELKPSRQVLRAMQRKNKKLMLYPGPFDLPKKDVRHGVNRAIRRAMSAMKGASLDTQVVRFLRKAMGSHV